MVVIIDVSKIKKLKNKIRYMNLKLIFTGALLSFALVSCYDELVNNPVGNQSPTTKLFLDPDSSISKQASKIKIHWTGDDPDGFIVGFYFSFDE